MAAVGRGSTVNRAMLPGVVATRGDWLVARVEQSAVVWGVERPRRRDTLRIAATLWWSMSSYVLMQGLVDALVDGTPVPDPALDRVEIRVGEHGALTDVVYRAAAPLDAGRALRATLGAVVAPLVEVTGVSVRSLWALASDALANRALEAAAATAAPAETGVAAAERLAAAIGPEMPAPRFVVVAGRTFVRRSSCCLYYFSPLASEGKCTSCPRRPPAQRCSLLAAAVRSAR